MNDLLKVIINFIKKHPMRYLVSFILMIGSSIAAVYPARIIGQVVDKIVASELNAEWLGTQLVVLVGIILVAYITESIWTYYIFIGHYEIQKELRVKLLRNNLNDGHNDFVATDHCGDFTIANSFVSCV